MCTWAVAWMTVKFMDSGNFVGILAIDILIFPLEMLCDFEVATILIDAFK